MREVSTIVALKNLATPWVIRTAAELSIMDRVIDGATSAQDIADECGTNEDATKRLVDYLIQLGMLRDGVDGLLVTALGATLFDDHPLGLRSWLCSNGGGVRWDAAFANLNDAVHTGGSVYSKYAGVEPWTEISMDTDFGDSVRRFMSNKTSWVVDEIASTLGSLESASVADLGGGDGTLACGLLERLPSLRATLVDRSPGSVSGDTAERLDIVVGDATQMSLNGHDVAILNNVLHNWADEQAVMFLKAASDCAKHVLVIETPLDVDSLMLRELDLLMLTVFGGRERLIEEYNILARHAGLAYIKGVPTKSGAMIMHYSKIGDCGE